MRNIKKLTLAALFLALGMVMPFLTIQIPEIGSMLLPMHIPVLVCGFVCGPVWGVIVGFITPLLRSVTFGMPPMIPSAVSMAFELATYGAVSGLLYKFFKKTKIGTYISLIGAMIAGRVVWGLVSIVIYGLMDAKFSWQIFVSGAFLTALPGIILQLVIIPPIIIIIKRFTKVESA